MAILFNRHRYSQSTSVGTKVKFLSGNIMSHVVVSSFISALGITALFLVDLVDIYFIGLLGEPKLAAAVGFAGTILFFTMSIGIAALITTATLLARMIGAGDISGAKRLYFHSMCLGILFAIALAICLQFMGEPILIWLGAKGDTLGFAKSYFFIVIGSFPLLIIMMMSSAVLRAFGAFGAATMVTLVGGISNAALDPLFIFYFGWGLDGAALASVCSRVVMVLVALYFVIFQYQFVICKFNFKELVSDAKLYLKTFFPVCLSNLTTPIGNGFVISLTASYGVGLVAGIAVIGRITPLLFAIILSLSGAIGPIIGQNFGATNYHRVRETVVDSIIFALAYVIIASACLFFAKAMIGSLFHLGPDGRMIVEFYATFISVSFIFVAIIFIANAFFNNIGKPEYATILNILRNLVFLIPLIYLGNWLGGAPGILVGQAVGAFCVALIAMVAIYKTVQSWDVSGSADVTR